MITNNFIKRHNGPSKSEVSEMLKVVNTDSVASLIDEIIPKNIRLKKDLNLPQGISEHEYYQWIKKLGDKNKIFKSYIGLGYYNTILPGVIQRNVLENPGWYTSYTPYQAEISQGRLEALLNFQTAIVELTGLPIANSSLLDEGTASAEAMILAYNSRSRKKKKANANKFFVSDKLFPQTIDVVATRAEPLGIEIVMGDATAYKFDDSYFGAIVQYPDTEGNVLDFGKLASDAHEFEMLVIAAADILSLSLLTPPGEWGADIAVGSTQRFGIPMGFGGPHAAYLATKEAYKRHIPGRIIGISIDKKGNRALRMALQTREQHIKREKATSNICTAQALLAIMAGFYTLYHGEEGLKNIAKDIHSHTKLLRDNLSELGFKIVNQHFFDTLTIELDNISTEAIKKEALAQKINFYYIDDKHLSISLDETTSKADVADILAIFAKVAGKDFNAMNEKALQDENLQVPKASIRQSRFMKQDIFNRYHSETEMMRYMKRLENRDLALNRTMIPLGSCTMKLNAATEMFSLSFPEFSAIHPFVPQDQAQGYLELIRDFNEILKEITGFDEISFQPNSGASGEYTGLMTIRAYHKQQQQGQRNVCLIPASAHGTNPASAAMAGMEIVIIKSTEKGEIDIDDLREKAVANKDRLAAFMITYPSTHGVFEERVREAVDIVHENGGQVYMDGANMNAQVAYTNPGFIGADVCHLNLHKTFAIPHGGGGPGIGPIGVKSHLVPFLPSNPVTPNNKPQAIKAISSALYGSALVLPIAYGYVKLLGGNGLKAATAYAMLNANYLKDRLKEHYPILYSGLNGRAAHEFIIDCNSFAHSADVTVGEIAKRLQDFGIHAPTVAFPVHGTLMIEPTESESFEELNYFIDVMIQIRKEIKAIEEGKADKANNVIKNAPHTCEMITDDNWDYPYTRREAAFALERNAYMDKYFPAVTKIDDGYGDRNLMCTCNTCDEDK